MKRTVDFEKVSRLVVVSGIPAGDSGTGRLVAHLEERITELAGDRIRLVSRPERPARWQIQTWLRNKDYRTVVSEVNRYAFRLGAFWWGLLLVWLKRNHRLILLHPQNLGYRLALRLLETRKQSSLIYLLDSSFFCVVSYNHISGSNESCVRCIEQGFDQVRVNGCKPFPRLDWTATEFAPRLRELVKAGRVNVAAQSVRQGELAQRHFGLKALPPVIGLWTQDWDAVFSGSHAHPSKVTPSEYAWDVLFHGHCLDAKGASWTANVARQCPDLRFMFPFAQPDWFEAPKNCSFWPSTWETGLQNEIVRSRFVIVPSLWSAPIEGSLVKSIACAEAVLVVSNPTSFSDELPDEIVMKLSADPEKGAVELKRISTDGWRPDEGIKKRWLDEFSKLKEDFVPDLLVAASSGNS